jgi:simple sugar transport system ATP-binding protein
MESTLPIAIEFRNVSKVFGDFYANRNLSFSIAKGSIHGLIGENGAGKSTAMKVLFGIQPKDEGEILVNGSAVKIKNPIHAMRLGIGMVHQHFMLADSETVLDNIILGSEPKNIFGMVLRKKAQNELTQICENYGIKFTRWDSKVQDLSVGEQQRAEIIKLLYQKSEVLILDEPTAVLTPQEVKELFTNLRKLKEEGKTIVLISHKLKEVLEFTDSVTVMRRGEVVGTKITSKTNEDELAEMMVGRKVTFTYQGPRRILSTQGVQPKPVLKFDSEKVKIELRPGEILGIAGVQGNGQTELLKVLSNPAQFGEKYFKAKYDYFINGKEIGDARPIDLRKMGVGLVPEDRLSEALLKQQDMTENFLLGQHHDDRYVHHGILGKMINRNKVNQEVEKNIREFDIRPPFTTVWAGRMSGGNQQKLVMARLLDPKPSILLIAHPTRGVDVGAVEKIHEAIMMERNQGKSIILFSSELDELIDLCDRMAVFFDGKVHGEFGRKEFDPWAIGKVMGGA